MGVRRLTAFIVCVLVLPALAQQAKSARPPIIDVHVHALPLDAKPGEDGFIAAGSFFSIRARVAKILPAPFTTGPMRALPILLVFGAMFYWLWRLRTRRLPALVRHDSMPTYRWL